LARVCQTCGETLQAPSWGQHLRIARNNMILSIFLFSQADICIMSDPALLLQRLEAEPPQPLTTSEIQSLVTLFLDATPTADLLTLSKCLVLVLQSPPSATIVQSHPKSSTLLRKCDMFITKLATVLPVPESLFMLVLLFHDIASTLQIASHASYVPSRAFFALFSNNEIHIADASVAGFVVLNSRDAIEKLVLDDSMHANANAFSVRFIEQCNRGTIEITKVCQFLTNVYALSSKEMLFYGADHAILEEVLMRDLADGENVDRQLAVLEACFAMFHFMKKKDIQHRQRWHKLLSSLVQNDSGQVNEDVMQCATHLLVTFADVLD
jgi:hypothetical protein